MILNYIGAVIAVIGGYAFLRKNKRNKRLRIVLRIVDFAVLIAIGLYAVKEGRAYFFDKADETLETAIEGRELTDAEILAEIGLKTWTSDSDQEKWPKEFRAWTEKTFRRKKARAYLPYARINDALLKEIDDKEFARGMRPDFTTGSYFWQENGFNYTATWRRFISGRAEIFVHVNSFTRHSLNRDLYPAIDDIKQGLDLPSLKTND